MRPLEGTDVEQAYRRYYQVLRQKCTRMLLDPAEAQDVAQETFARLLVERLRLDDPRSMVAWLYRTSTRLAVDNYRRRRRLEPIGVEAATRTDDVDAASRLDAIRLLERLSASTPSRELEIAVFHRLDGLSYQEIGLVTSMSGRTVRRILARFDSRVVRLQRSEDRAFD